MTNNVLASELHPFHVGDRVSERARMKFQATSLDKNIGNRKPRTGRVERVETEINKRGSRMEFVYVVWDGLKTPSKHMRNRIVKIG
jgi:hypothetical protein